jgi:hypothetical protein
MLSCGVAFAQTPTHNLTAYKLDSAQAAILTNKTYMPGAWFGPTPDCYGQYFISVEEVGQLTPTYAAAEGISWVLSLPPSNNVCMHYYTSDGFCVFNAEVEGNGIDTNIFIPLRFNPNWAIAQDNNANINKSYGHELGYYSITMKYRVAPLGPLRYSIMYYPKWEF